MTKILRFYHRWRELSTIIGYFIMLGSILTGLWIGFSFIAQANENTARIDSLELWRAGTAITLARIEQKLDDVHDATVKK